MNIAVIYGSMRHGTTYHCAESLIEALSGYEEAEISRFFLPRDMSEMCQSCYSCFLNGEQSCPHNAQVRPIVDALERAQVIILASPVYALDVSGPMKTLLDHLCYLWVTHRPSPVMFSKIGVAICTTGGAGLNHTAKTLTNSLKFWGTRRQVVMKRAVGASKWEEVSPKNRAWIAINAHRLAARIAKAVKKTEKLPVSPFMQGLFFIMSKVMKNNTWSLRDKEYWDENGWLAGGRPY